MTVQADPQLPHTPRSRLREVERLVSRWALRVSVAALLFVAVVLFLRATSQSLAGQPWRTLRGVAAWLVPVYLLLTLSGVTIGLYSAWGATTTGVRKRGIGAAIVAMLSIVVLLLGNAWLVET